MIWSPLFWVFLGTFALFWYLNKKWKAERERNGLKELPGPTRYPIVGNTLQVGKMPHKKFIEWMKDYGDIYQFDLGSYTNVVVSNPKWIKEIMTDGNYVGRPNFNGFELYENEPVKLGIINSEGEMWEVHRRFLLRQLRDFGFGKSIMEGLIIEEVNETMAAWNTGKPIKDIKKQLTIAVINSLWSIISQKRFKHDDPKLLQLLASSEKVFSDLFENGGFALFFLIPILAKIAPEFSGYNKIRRMFDGIREWFVSEVDDRKKTYEEGTVRDFIDAFLAEKNATKDKNSVFYGDLAERQLVSTLFDMFFAGSDTTSTTITWQILYLCYFPGVQRKFQDEIAAVTGNSRNVSVNDKPNMPFTMALIDEVLRYSSIVPNGVQHRAIESKEFRGYFIPKDAWVMPNLYYLHHNPDIWGDPENFRPERFLSEDGTKYIKNENLLAFQIGRRACVGELLARDSIFLFTTNLFQKFEMKFDPNEPKPSLEPKPNFLLAPFPYSVVMKDRLQ